METWSDKLLIILVPSPEFSSSDSFWFLEEGGETASSIFIHCQNILICKSLIAQHDFMRKIPCRTNNNYQIKLVNK